MERVYGQRGWDKNQSIFHQLKSLVLVFGREVVMLLPTAYRTQ